MAFNLDSLPLTAFLATYLGLPLFAAFYAWSVGCFAVGLYRCVRAFALGVAAVGRFVVRLFRPVPPYWGEGEFEQFWTRETIRDMAVSLGSAAREAVTRAGHVQAAMASPTFRAVPQPTPHVVREEVRRMGDLVYDHRPTGETSCADDKVSGPALHGYIAWLAAVPVVPDGTFCTDRRAVYGSYARFVKYCPRLPPSEFWRQLRAGLAQTHRTSDGQPFTFVDTTYDNETFIGKKHRTEHRDVPRWRNAHRTVPLLVADELPTYDTTGQQLRAVVDQALPVARPRKRL